MSQRASRFEEAHEKTPLSGVFSWALVIA